MAGRQVESGPSPPEGRARHRPKRPKMRHVFKMRPRWGPRITIKDVAGNTLAKLSDVPEGEEPGKFIAPHGVCIDSRGNIYVAEFITGGNITKIDKS